MTEPLKYICERIDSRRERGANDYDSIIALAGRWAVKHAGNTPLRDSAVGVYKLVAVVDIPDIKATKVTEIDS